VSIPVTEEHEALAESVGRWAADRCPESLPQEAFDADADALPSLWEDIASQGWLGIHLPEEHGGVGYGLEELAVVLEQLGRAMVPGPFLPTVLAAELVHRTGSDKAISELLPGFIDGSRPAGISLQPTLTAQRDGDGLTVSGTTKPVMGGAVAGVLVLAANVDGDDVWFVVDADQATVTELKSFDGSRREAKVELDGVSVSAERVLTGLTTEQARDLAATLFSAEAAGIAGWAVDTAADYAKVREQFGRPIGQFQGVKHRCADMLVRSEQAQGVAWDAARAGSDGDFAELRLPATAAAAVALEGAFENAKDCIQVLGGIGFTWEHAAHMYLKRAMALRAHLGASPAPWRQRAAKLALSGVRRNLSLDLGEEAEGHRTQVREFLASLEGLDDQAKRNRMAEEGYIVPHLPKPWGREAGAIEQLVIDEEFRDAGERRPGLGIAAWVVPSVIAYGTEEQKEKYLGPTFRGEMIWCQMFSEPGAGSDLASLSMKATRVDGGYLLTGQKVWTSGAHVSQHAICLARTSRDEDSKHFGITYFLLDMKAEGVDVRPLREITGEALFNEVFCNDVFVPDEDVLGDVDDGWRVARNTLSNERVSLSGGSMIGGDVEGLLRQVSEDSDPTVLERVGFLITRGQSLGLLGYRSTMRTLSGTEPGASSSVRNLLGSEHGQDVAQLSHELLGADAATMEDVAAMTGRGFLFQRAVTIYGGSSEIQRNVIAERVLGLPRDP
jgi:3-oxochol-4-en-24-oyl-CoA dehydrogenase